MDVLVRVADLEAPRLELGMDRVQPGADRVALSGVDENGAVANLDAEPGGFDATLAATRARWEKAFGAVTIDAPAPIPLPTGATEIDTPQTEEGPAGSGGKGRGNSGGGNGGGGKSENKGNGKPKDDKN